MHINEARHFLTEDEWYVLRRHVRDGLPLKEIAKRMHTTIKKVKSILAAVTGKGEKRSH